MNPWSDVDGLKNLMGTTTFEMVCIMGLDFFKQSTVFITVLRKNVIVR